MAKSADAFRTISEVAEILQVPAHVLRFWESRFAQVKPVKRAGGRRYYRPDDIRLLSGIRMLLHDEGMTIKGVQKILREHGVRHVVALAPALSEMQPDPPDAGAAERAGAEVLSFAPRSSDAADPAPPAADTDAEACADQDEDDGIMAEPAPETAAPLEPALTAQQAAAPPADETAPPHAAPSPPPLPDLPDDPPDDPPATVPARAGALSALGGLRGPVSPDLATRLSAIATRLRGLDADRRANHAGGD